MDTKQLATFVNLLREKSYLKTSLKLNYAPSTLAEHIRALEGELGVKLVQSRGKQIVATDAGLVFLRYAEEFLALYQKTQEEFASTEIQGNIKIATAESIGQYSMAELFRNYAVKFPKVDLTIRLGNCAGFLEMIHNHEIHFGYLYDLAPIDLPHFSTLPLFVEPLFFVAHPDHRLAAQESVTPKDLEGENLALTYTDCCYSMALKQTLSEHSVTTKSKSHLGSVSIIKNYVKANCGVALLPLTVVKPAILSGELKLLNWVGKPFSICAQMVYAKKLRLTPAMTTLLELSTEYAKKHQETLAAPFC